MWAYRDHPHTRTPGCPLISSKGQPFLRLSKHASYAMIIILCLRSCHCKTWKTLHRFLWFAAAKPAFSSALPPVPLYHILTLSKTPLLFFLTSIHQSIHPKKKKPYYCLSHSPGKPVTSMLPLGLPLLQAPALFPGRIIPFKLQSYLQPILSPYPPGAIKLFIQRTSCHPALS